jgi:hypothetical protein
MRILSKTLTAAAVAAIALVASAPSHAIPAWTRATGTPCITCHFGATNRLTKMGIDFLSRGHRLPGEESFNDETAGETNILNYVSLSARGNIVSFRQHQTPSTTFGSPTFSLLAGGPLVQNLSFYTTYDLTTGGSAGLGEAYAQYTSDVEAPNYWWARAGKFNPHVNWLGRIAIGGSSAAISRNAGLGNTFSPSSNINGVSAGYDAKSGFAAEVGIQEGLAGTGATNNDKNVFGSLRQMFDEYGSSVGLLAYRGTFAYGPSGTTANPIGPWNDDYTRAGVLGQFLRDKWEVHGAYFTGRNELRLGGHRSPWVWYAEADYNPFPDHTAYIRYDRSSDDIPGASVTSSTVTGAKNLTLGYGLRYTQWSRFTASYTDARPTGPGGRKTSNFTLGWSFFL